MDGSFLKWSTTTFLTFHALLMDFPKAFGDEAVVMTTNCWSKGKKRKKRKRNHDSIISVQEFLRSRIWWWSFILGNKNLCVWSLPTVLAYVMFGPFVVYFEFAERRKETWNTCGKISNDAVQREKTNATIRQHGD